MTYPSKTHYTWEDVHKCAHKLALEMYKTGFKPDYIVGLNRGGLPLSVVLSHLLDVNHYALDVRLRDGDTGPESNLWMAEDAFGYVSELDRDGIFEKSSSDSNNKKNILVVDDINDTGATFEWIKQDWQSGCLPHSPNWDTVWGKNVRFAVMCEKTHTNFDGVDYVWKTIDTSEEDTWVVFPWEYD
jgi:hypoxanthine phosphoribosyltransferase